MSQCSIYKCFCITLREKKITLILAASPTDQIARSALVPEGTNCEKRRRECSRNGFCFRDAPSLNLPRLLLWHFVPYQLYGNLRLVATQVTRIVT